MATRDDMPTTKRPRLGSQRSLALTSQLEARPTEWAGNGIFALADLPAGWMWKDHPVCVPRRAGEEAAGVAERRLPRADDVDELMQELSERALAGDERCGRLLSGEWAMTHMPRHLEAQGDGPDEMPQWALDCGTPAAGYNLLAAQLQSNVARHAEGGGFVLNPQARAMHMHMHTHAHMHTMHMHMPCHACWQLRLVNHACGGAANTELAWVPPPVPPLRDAVDAAGAGAGAEACPCGLGHYAARARRPIGAGEELTYSCARRITEPGPAPHPPAPHRSPPACPVCARRHRRRARRGFRACGAAGAAPP